MLDANVSKVTQSDVRVTYSDAQMASKPDTHARKQAFRNRL